MLLVSFLVGTKQARLCGALENALLADADPIALLVGLRSARNRVQADRAMPPTSRKDGASSDAGAAQPARAKPKKPES